MKRSIEYIESVVCAKRGILPQMLHIKSRSRELVETRQIIIFFSMLSGNTILSSSNYFGLNHATAIHSKKHINDLIDFDKNFKLEIEDIAKEIENGESYHQNLQEVLYRLKKETKELQDKLESLKA
jgi:chromosomal replication initiation ATPase DnaA